jgi:hypothetical protein
MQALNVFQSEIALSVGNIHTPIIDNAVVGAAIEFCDKTRAWEEQLNQLSVNPGVAEYELDYDTNCMVLIGLTEVYHDSQQIGPNAKINLERSSRDWRSREADTPTAYYMQSPNVIRFYPAFNDSASGSLDFYGTFKPNRRTKTLPDFLYDDYFDAIVAGAEARLHSMKGRSWYSPNDSVEARQVFKVAVEEAKLRARKSRTRSGFKLRIRGAA